MSSPDAPEPAPLGGELARRMGIEFVELFPSRVVATMPAVGNH